MIIAKEDALKYLAHARELQGEFPSVDLHVSPFEVIFNSFRYSPNPYEDGIVSVDNTRYRPPSVGPLSAGTDTPRISKGGKQRDAERMSLFLYRQVFAHIGPRVLGDQMRLSGIKRSMLLPVLHPQSDGKVEMDFVYSLYGGDERFSIGYCIPNTIRQDSLLGDVRSAREKYGITAIKVNANISEIDLSTSAGKERVEAILDACQSTRLPIVVHGGNSHVLKNLATKSYSSLRNLADIDWGITKEPVVISHGGMMGASSAEIEQELMPRLKSILSLHDHMMVDISALEVPAICLVLRNIETERIVFGSDYHYFTQWGTIVKLFHALKTTSDRVEDQFLKIVAVNPSRFLLREVKC